MIIKYLGFSVSIVFMSFILGMLATTWIRKTKFYNEKLANLNFLKNEKLNNILGVSVVKFIVKNTFVKNLNQELKMEGKINVYDLKNIRNQMTKAEIDHLFAFLFVTILVILKVCNQEFVFAFI